MELTLDQLPYVCLAAVCEYLSAEDLGRFCRVCKSFQFASTAESLWRQHCLSRWAFCDIKQIKAESHKWHRYYLARRKVENHMDQGRPTKDYRVKSLRGHKSDILMGVSLEGSNIDWEHLVPPHVITLSSDSIVYAWDVMEAKTVWSIEDQPVSFIAGSNELNLLATGTALGQVTLYNVSDWSVTGSVALEGSISCIKFIKFQSSILIAISYPDQADNGIIKIWNPLELNESPLIILQSTILCTQMVYGFGQWLAGYNNSTSDIIPIWNLANISDRSIPIDPHLTVHSQSSDTLMWLQSGVLATTAVTAPQYFGFFPHPGVPGGHLQRRVRRRLLVTESKLEVWNVTKRFEEYKKSAIGRINQVSCHMYESKEINLLQCGACNVIKMANNLLLIGDSTGRLSVVEPNTGNIHQQFQDHKGTITDLHADAYRVLTCSSDFSIRVYRWVKPGNGGGGYQLESLYQLLGGSVALKTHDGFNQVLCSASSCLGIAGNIVKVYNFNHQLEQ